MSRVAYLWVALLVGLVCQPSNGNVLKQELEEKDTNRGKRHADDVRDEILSLTAQIKTAVEENDVAALANMYDPDVVVMANGYPTYQGLDILERYLGWVNYASTINADAQHIDVLGSDHALQRQNYEVIGLDGSTVTKEGKSLLLWKKSDEGWKIALEMYNDNS